MSYLLSSVDQNLSPRRIFAAGVLKCPNHVPLYQAWACLEIRGGDYERAKILISEALTRDKGQGSGWLVAAKIEEKRGNRGLAGLILQRGLECDPNDAQLYCALAELEVRRGKIDHVSVADFGLSYLRPVMLSANSHCHRAERL